MSSRDVILFLFGLCAVPESAIAIFPSVFMTQNLLYTPAGFFSVRVFALIRYFEIFRQRIRIPRRLTSFSRRREEGGSEK